MTLLEGLIIIGVFTVVTFGLSFVRLYFSTEWRYRRQLRRSAKYQHQELVVLRDEGNKTPV